MDTDAKGQLGGLDTTKDVRERLAAESKGWKCTGCGKSNAEIMREREEVCSEEKTGQRKEDIVPDELRLAYRDELQTTESGPTAKEPLSGSISSSTSTTQHQPVAPVVAATTSTPGPAPVPRPTRTVPMAAPSTRQLAQQTPDRSLAWIDTCIYGVVAALLFMVLRKFS